MAERDLKRIQFNTVELMIAGTFGVIRRCQNIRNGERKTEDFGLASNASWQTDIEGVMAEMALAKHLNVFWMGSYGVYKGPDVGPYHVRSTKHKSGHLIVRPKDKEIPDDATLVLCIVGKSYCDIAGCIRAGEARDPSHWRDDEPGREGSGGGGWWVPQEKLVALEL